MASESRASESLPEFTYIMTDFPCPKRDTPTYHCPYGRDSYGRYTLQFLQQPHRPLKEVQLGPPKLEIWFYVSGVVFAYVKLLL